MTKTKKKARLKEQYYTEANTSRNFRCQDSLWRSAKEQAIADDVSLSEVIRTALREYVSK